MGVMPVNRLLLTMSLPMMISMLVQALYNVVDSVFVSYISEDALAAVGLAFPFAEIFSFSLSCFFMFYMYRTVIQPLEHPAAE